MILLISSSLKVVSMAVSFLAATRRLEMVLRRVDIFTRFSVRFPGVTSLVSGVFDGGDSALADSAGLGVVS